ncbi:MAG: hypothetical protein A2381_19380 [Bdellovibrionales bacterium RIFOXYB1_FULL_37_110]|nr:MAG: hypothetical protein A2381_19380 [Bdellovibrionales bacterium RIFOXYB1_FULL_37_110]
MGIFFTSDFHFFHTNLLGYTNRHKIWNDVDEMNEGIIKRWNSVIGLDDDIYVLGDLHMGGKSKSEQVTNLLKRLNGSRESRVIAGLSDESRIYFIAGNHDDHIFNNDAGLKEINVLPPLYELKVQHPEGGRKKVLMIVMCHYPLFTWNHAGKVIGNKNGTEYPSSICLCGHSHTEKSNIDTGTTRLDVGLDGHNYYPWSLSEVWDFLKNKQYRQIDHHGKDTNHAT